MRYMARRITTGRWLHRDLPLTDTEFSRVLSGPSVISASVEPELRNLWDDDGLRLLDPFWSTMIYACTDEGAIKAHGIIIPGTGYEASKTAMTCAGVTAYPHGWKFREQRMWGPQHEKPTKNSIEFPELPRPDPVQIFRDLWDHIQSTTDADLGVEVTGSQSSTVRIGTYEEPYRLEWHNVPDVGSEMDTLAQNTPFDYVEEVGWRDPYTQRDPYHHVKLGFPRLGRRRTDLRFALGENVVASTEAKAPEAFANEVLGIGNGTGTTLVYTRATVRDGRLLRTAVVTDKTIRDKTALQKLTGQTLEALSVDVDIESVTIRDHVNARIAAIDPGDDIYVQTFVPSFGNVAVWVRVLSITHDESATEAVLKVQRSNSFIYNTTTGVQ